MKDVINHNQLQRGFKFNFTKEQFLSPTDNGELFESKLLFLNCAPLKVDHQEQSFYRHPNSPILDVLDNYIRPTHLLSTVGYYSILVRDDKGVRHHLIDRPALAEESNTSTKRIVESNVSGIVMIYYRSLLKFSKSSQMIDTDLFVSKGEVIADSFTVQPTSSTSGVLDVAIENESKQEKVPVVIKLDNCPNKLVLEPTVRTINRDILEHISKHYNKFNTEFCREQLVALLQLARDTNKYLSYSIEQNILSLLEEMDYSTMYKEVMLIKTTYLISSIMNSYTLQSTINNSGYLRLEVTPDIVVALDGCNDTEKVLTTGKVSVHIDNLSAQSNKLIAKASMEESDHNAKTVTFKMPADTRISVAWVSSTQRLCFSSLSTFKEGDEVTLRIKVVTDIYDKSITCMIAEITCGDITEMVKPKVH